MTDSKEHFTWKARLFRGLSIVPIIVVAFVLGQRSRQVPTTIFFRLSSAGLLALSLSWIFKIGSRFRWIFVGAGVALVFAGLALYLALK
jgi:hypothetical protein